MYNSSMTVNDSILLSYLVSDFTVSVRDPLWGDMLFTPALSAFYRHPQMRKLDRIRQLGPVSLLYPGAVHTRFSHSLGVCDISRRMLISLLRNGCRHLTKTGINSFLCAALLHDLGHFPFAHSLKDVVSRSHESLGTEIIRGDRELKELIKNAGADVDTVCCIICPEENPVTDPETIFYQHLLSGALDPDKLDYLSRDAYYCGVPYGVQDVSYITEHMYALDSRPALKITNAASVEHLLFSKYLMYKNVYWHSATRCATAMVKNAVKMALSDNVIKEEDLYFLDDAEFLKLCESKKYKPFELVTLSSSGLLYNTNCERQCPGDLSDDEIEELRKNAASLAPGRSEKYQIIVDVPERISFETDISIIGTDGKVRPFYSADELFSETGVAYAFTKTLRKVRVYTPFEGKF